MDEILNLIFFPGCIICKERGDILCRRCLTSCEYIRDRFCMICNKPENDGKIHQGCLVRIPYKIKLELFSAYYYQEIIRKCIRLSKYKARLFTLLKKLTKEALRYSMKFSLNYTNYIVIPIPIHNKKYKERGFNQADVIAKEVSKFYKLRYRDNLLIRSVYTKSQYMSTRKDRYLNLKNVFQITKKYQNKIIGNKFMLVDDLCTSGATFLEAANLLYVNGAVEVRCFSLAKKF